MSKLNNFAMKDVLDVHIFDEHGNFIINVDCLNLGKIYNKNNKTYLLMNQEIISPVFMQLKSGEYKNKVSDFDKMKDSATIKFNLTKENNTTYKMIGKAKIKFEGRSEMNEIQLIIDKFKFVKSDGDIFNFDNNVNEFNTIIECENVECVICN